MIKSFIKWIIFLWYVKLIYFHFFAVFRGCIRKFCRFLQQLSTSHSIFASWKVIEHIFFLFCNILHEYELMSCFVQVASEVGKCFVGKRRTSPHMPELWICWIFETCCKGTHKFVICFIFTLISFDKCYLANFIIAY